MEGLRESRELTDYLRRKCNSSKSKSELKKSHRFCVPLVWVLIGSWAEWALGVDENGNEREEEEEEEGAGKTGVHTPPRSQIGKLYTKVENPSGILSYSQFTPIFSSFYCLCPNPHNSNILVPLKSCQNRLAWPL